MREEDLPEVQIAEEINKLEPVDLSQPVVTEPIINEEVLLEPENIPEDVRDLVFVEGAKSVPITKEEIPTISVQEVQAVEEAVQEVQAVEEAVQEVQAV
ncbi:MAG: hypothetical protein ACTSP3_13785, partial [Candidatus Heimdallarchaeaceae archaeon]